MAKQEIVKNVESFTVSLLDNGYTIDYSGLAKNGDWVSKKLVLTDLDNLIKTIKMIDELESE